MNPANPFLAPAPEDDESLAGLSDTERQDTLRSYRALETMFDRVRLPDELVAQLDCGPLAIPGYETIRRLGAGSFGEVFLARDEQLGRQVAIKRLFHVPASAAISNSAAPGHFTGSLEPGELATSAVTTGQNESEPEAIREARMISRLRHPGIVALLSVVEHEAAHCLVSEFVDGPSLADLLSEDVPMRISRALRYGTQLADALAHAHQRNVVHRDLKPANILIDSEDCLRVADFGLAIRDDDQRAGRFRVAGTVEYMAPEQLPESAGYIDGRADIWSLGVILYRMLTGQLPFQGHSTEETFAQIRSRPPKPLRQLRPEVSKRLERLCLHCLAKDPQQRPSSASEVRDILKSLSRAPADPQSTLPMRVALIGAALIGVLFVGNFALNYLRERTRETALRTEFEPTLASSTVPSNATRVSAMRLRHYRFDAAGTGTDLGLLGITTDYAIADDDLRIEVELTRPAHYSLLEVTADGRLLEHARSDPGQTSQRFVFPTDSESTLGLSDGAGLQAVVVVAADQPLLEFWQWLAARPSTDVAWFDGSESDTLRSVGVWRFSHDAIDPRHYLRQRGRTRDHGAAPAAFRDLCQLIIRLSGDSTVHAIAYPVLTKPDRPSIGDGG